MLKKLLTIGIICTSIGGAYAYDGYNIPCSQGGTDSCICDAGTCTNGASWNDSLGTFTDCKNGSTCTCIDVLLNKTITFTCGCTSSSDCSNGQTCSNGQCVTCKTCSNCTSGSWEDYGTGYQRILNKSCNCDGTCSSSYSYRCAAGYYGSSSNGTSGCTRCPASGGVYGSSTAGSTAITACYIPSGTSFSDTGGSGTYTSNCYYTN